MMVLAAGAVMAFGCFGIAGITGYLPRGSVALSELPAFAVEQPASPAPTPPQAADSPANVVAAANGVETPKSIKPAGVRKPTVN